MYAFTRMGHTAIAKGSLATTYVYHLHIFVKLVVLT